MRCLRILIQLIKQKSWLLIWFTEGLVTSQFLELWTSLCRCFRKHMEVTNATWRKGSDRSLAGAAVSERRFAAWVLGEGWKLVLARRFRARVPQLGTQRWRAQFCARRFRSLVCEGGEQWNQLRCLHYYLAASFPRHEQSKVTTGNQKRDACIGNACMHMHIHSTWTENSPNMQFYLLSIDIIENANSCHKIEVVGQVE